MENERKISMKRALFTSFIDLMIAITLVFTITLGLKYSYEIFFSDYQTKQSLVAIDEKLDNKISRSEFVAAPGDVIFKLRIEGITGWIPVLEGETLVNLAQGAAHNETTGFPGDNRQIFTSGHRDSHYKDIDKAKAGDIITVETPYGRYEYVVDHTKIVNQEEISVIKSQGLAEDELVLMTCYPFANWQTAKERYLVYAYPKKD